MAIGSATLLRTSGDHLREAGESYGAHMRFALLVGATMVAAGLSCLLHALVPGLCRNTASRTIRALHRLIADRGSVAEVEAECDAPLAFALLIVLAFAAGASLWAAGTTPAVAAPVTLLALGFPASLLATDRDLEG